MGSRGDIYKANQTLIESSESEDTETTMRGGGARPRSSNSMLAGNLNAEDDFENEYLRYGGAVSATGSHSTTSSVSIVASPPPVTRNVPPRLTLLRPQRGEGSGATDLQFCSLGYSSTSVLARGCSFPPPVTISIIVSPTM